MRRSIILSAALCAFSLQALAAGKVPTFFVEPSSKQTMDTIADRYQVVQRIGDGYEVAVPEAQVEALRALAPGMRPLRDDLEAGVHTADKETNDVASVERRLRAFVQQYPDLVKLETYGTSRGGRPEYVLTMTKGVAEPDLAKPGLMITSATHGNELVTVDVTMALIEKLLKGHGTNERLTKMVDDHVIYWMPMLCVDGYANRSRQVDGVDPNRDFPYPQSPNRQPRSQCTKDAMSFFDTHTNVVGTMDFHASGSMIMFPWAYTYNHIAEADYRKMDELTTYMAEANGFAHGDIATTIYVAPGSSADFYYWKRGATALAIEVSHNLAPKATRDIISENTESTWRFIESFTN